MRNRDVGVAWTYHEWTKLSYINLDNKPPQYKSYPGLPAISLPADFSPPVASALDAVGAVDLTGGPALDINILAQLLFYSAGLIRKRTVSEAGEVHYRAAASAGALYPVEVYLVCPDIPGLKAGVYHFSPFDFALHQLRVGDYRGELCRFAAGDPAIATSAVTLVFTAVFWRSAWKYRARSYRYCFWDSGTILANLLAAAAAADLPARVTTAFVDSSVNQLVGLAGEGEASVCLVSIGHSGAYLELPSALDLSPLPSGDIVFAGEEADYPEIWNLHAASSLATEEQVAAWRGGFLQPASRPVAPFYPLAPTADLGNESSGQLGDVVRERGSIRRFARQPITLSQLSAILDRSTRGVPADFSGREGTSLVEVYLIVNAVAGLPEGAYFFSPQRQGLELLGEGSLREEVGHLCFEQALGADASAVVFLKADLNRVLNHYGNRGYRAAQLEAGTVGGKIYLCAHSLGLGASGLTFYDDEATEFFSPHAAGKSTMFVVALGLTHPNNRIRPFRSRIAGKLEVTSHRVV